MKPIKLELTPFESKTLKYILDHKFLIPKSGPQLSACTRINAKLLVCLKQKGLMEKSLLKGERKPPEKKVEMRQKMQEFASKHNLIINQYAETKIEWMEKHGRRCYCEPDGSRICPCKFCLKDIKEFNGCCLCRVFVTDDKMKRIEKYQKQKS